MIIRVATVPTVYGIETDLYSIGTLLHLLRVATVLTVYGMR